MDDSIETSAEVGRAIKASANFTEKQHWALFAATLLAIAILPWLAVLDLPYSLFCTYIAPWPVLLALIIRAGGIQGSREKAAKDLLIHNYQISPEEANSVWKKAPTTPGVQILSFLVSLCYLLFMFQWDIISDRSYFSGGFFQIVANIILSAWFVVQAIAFSCLPVAAIRDDSRTIRITSSETENSILDLKPSERNDIEIITIEVDLSMSAKRVDAYTLESTLLSALAFSAFIAILYSEKYDLKGHLIGTEICAHPSVSNIQQCVNALIVSPKDENIKIYICAFLLSCSICFLSVLIARLRFSEAFRHVEELLKITQKVNERENALEAANSDSAKSLTDEIEKMMGRLRTGSTYLRPMLRFIKAFRDTGIFFFVMSIATCSWYFGRWMPALVLLVFFLASAYTFADRMWHQAGLIPLIRSALPGIVWKRPR